MGDSDQSLIRTATLTVAAEAAGSILVIEDRMVSNLVRAVLRKQGYAVTAVDAAAAVARIQSPESRVELLITNSPGPFLEFSDQVPMLYLTSSPDPDLQAAFRACRVVRKPFAPAELVDAVRELMGT